MNAGAAALVVTLLVAGPGCRTRSPVPGSPDVPPAPAVAETPAQPPAVETIGVATMTEDRTIVLRLHAQGASGARGEAIIRYPRDHPDYDRIREHVGPLEPGQTVLVRPWPE